MPDHAPDHTAPDHTAPDHTAPDHTAPDHTAPDHTAPDHTPPDQTPPGHRTPEQDGRTPSSDEAGRPGPTIRHPLPLLESLFNDHLDPGYQAAADRRAAAAAAAAAESGGGVDASAGAGGVAGRGTRPRAVAYLVAGVVIVGLVLGVALTTTKDRAAGAEQARRSLLQDIDSAQTKQSALAAQQSSLTAVLRSAQASLGAGGPLATISRLEMLGAQTEVSGPGLTVVIDGSSASSGAGVLLDRDIQLLVNGLWSAGAEAIAVGGVRLRSTSAIRQAGSAMLVDNRPVFFPISIQAVGDPATLHVEFVGTVGFGRFQTFVSLYGIRFDLSAQTAITLPPAGAPNLLFASVPVPTTALPTGSAVPGTISTTPLTGSPPTGTGSTALPTRPSTAGSGSTAPPTGSSTTRPNTVPGGPAPARQATPAPSSR